MARSKTSSQWLKRHVDDFWVQEAQKEGWRSRAVYKLKEIDDKDKLLQAGMTLLDLGSAPGGWSQYASEVLQGRGKIIATDILPMDSLPQVTFVQGDFTEDEVLQQILTLMEGQQADLVLSDMAPNLSGMKAIDQPKSFYLAELALDLAQQLLKPQGNFLVKVFQGEGYNEYLNQLKLSFDKVISRKPKASRPKSREIYLLGKGFKQIN